MKVRRVMVSIEVDTDMTVNEIKDGIKYQADVQFLGMDFSKVWNVIKT